MKTSLYLATFLSLVTSSGVASAGIGFSRTFGDAEHEDEGFSVSQTSDGGLLVVGRTITQTPAPPEGNDVFAMKTDGQGNEQWRQVIGKTFAELDMGLSAIQTSDGANLVSVDEGKLIKIGNDGGVIWENQYYDYCYAPSVTETPDGGIALLATHYLPTMGCRGVYLIKTDAEGNEQWNQSIADGFAGNVLVSDYGGYFVTVASSNRVIQTDDLGVEEWTQAFSDPAPSFFGAAPGLYEGYVVTGNQSGAGTRDIVLYGVAPDGETIFAQSYADDLDSTGMDVAQTADDGYVIAGASGDDIVLLKTDGVGNLLWREVVGSGVPRSIEALADGSFVVTGATMDGDVILLQYCEARLGDVNGNCLVDIIDALLVSQYYVGLPVVDFDPSVADVNCDGTIDIVDALLISQYDVGLITEFACGAS